MRSKITAALVAVLLTAAAATPALAQQAKTHLGGRPSAMVRLFANVPPGGITQSFQEVAPDGTTIGDFDLPEGTVLVVTDMQVGVNGPVASGVTRGGVIAGANVQPYFSVDFSKQAGYEVHLTSGVRYSVTPRAINAVDSVNHVFFSVYGYLAKDS